MNGTWTVHRLLQQDITRSLCFSKQPNHLITARLLSRSASFFWPRHSCICLVAHWMVNAHASKLDAGLLSLLQQSIYLCTVRLAPARMHLSWSYMGTNIWLYEHAAKCSLVQVASLPVSPCTLHISRLECV